MLTPVAMYLYYDRQKLNRQHRQETPALVPVIIFLIFFGFAAYLSWQCNSNKPETISPAMKIIYALGAGLDNFSYILNYYIFQRNTQSICKSN
jgi:hypothetical protein